MITTQFVLSGIVLPSGVHIGSMGAGEVSGRVQQILERSAGVPNTQFGATLSSMPEITFDTPDLSKVFTAAPNGYLAIAGNCDLYFRKVIKSGTRALITDPVNSRYRMTTGMLLVNSLRASQNQQAQASCRLVVGFDGTNDPIVRTPNVAIPSAPTSAFHYSLGPWWLDLQPVAGVQDATIDFGWSLFQQAGGGDVWPSFIAIQEQTPTLTLSGIEMDPAAVLDLYGKSGDGRLDGYFLRISDRGHRFANNVAQHVSVNAVGHTYLDRVGGGGNNAATGTIRLSPIDTTGTGNLITIVPAATVVTPTLLAEGAETETETA